MKIFSWSQTLGYMSSQGMPAPSFFLFMATAIEIVGGLALLSGLRLRLGSAILFLYLIPVTLIFHNFWAHSGLEAQNQMAHFMKNLGLMGGLLGFFVWGGPFNGNRAATYHD
jgi:putative oxidoreductase